GIDPIKRCPPEIRTGEVRSSEGRPGEICTDEAPLAQPRRVHQICSTKISAVKTATGIVTVIERLGSFRGVIVPKAIFSALFDRSPTARLYPILEQSQVLHLITSCLGYRSKQNGHNL